ncbi:TPA: alpha-glucosidase/alpha-galactosidase [Enterococcus faecium]
MTKITFIGAGSTIFAKNVLGDAMLTPSLQDAHIALYDIDEKRLKESNLMLKNINKNSNENRADIVSYYDRKEALREADFVINAIQVGGYKPSTVIDFDIPKKYGLRQTIGDTMGIGGIFRTLRTLPVMLDFAKEMEEVCPNAWLLNYTNPMAMLTMGVLKATSIKTVGLCHSVQVCVPELIDELGIPLDEYLRRFEQQINDWESMREDIVNNGELTHTRSREYASYIMDSITTGTPSVIAGNVLNKGLITNLPTDVCVEVPCLVDKNGVQPTYVGELPTQLAALNRTNINVQELTVEAALTLDKSKIYQAAYLDPHLSSELSLTDIKNLVDDLIEAHGDYLPEYN